MLACLPCLPLLLPALQTSAAVQRVASSINIVMTYGGRPNTEGIKMLWLNDRIDLSNCTAI